MSGIGKTFSYRHYFRKYFMYTVHCFGDSHIGVFDTSILQSAMWFIRFRTIRAGAATVSGLKNPNPRSGSTKMFGKALSALPSNSLTIVCLGEVDTGFVIWWRAEHREIGVEEAFRQALENYSEFLCKFQRFSRCVVVSAPLPTIPDGYRDGEVANARWDVKATQLEKTKLTLRFNREMEKRCKRMNISYINLDKYSMDPITGLVKKTLLREDKTDHHYAPNAYATLLLPHLRKSFILYRIIPSFFLGLLKGPKSKALKIHDNC